MIFHLHKEISMAWLLLIIAGLLEVVWAVGLKYTEGFSRLFPSLLTGLAMLGSVGLLGIAMKSIPAGTAYSTWVGVGIVGTVSVGVMLLGEPVNVPRILGVLLIIGGIVCLALGDQGLKAL